jgi:hypothetical protein
MAPPTFQEKKQQQTHVFQEQVVTQEKQEQIKQKLESGVYNYEFDFTRSQAQKQQDFYGDYEHKWGEKSQGYLVAPPEYVNPVELEVEDRKLGYREKIRRKQSAQNNYGIWMEKLRKLNFRGGKEKVTETEDGFEHIELKETAYGLRFDDTKDRGSDAFDIMKSTARVAAIERWKMSLFLKLLKENANEDNKKLVKKHLNVIMSLSPPLVAVKNDDLSGNIAFTEESQRNVLAYARKVIEDPVAAIKTAVSDSLFSYGKISTKMLEKNNIAESFDQAKLLRDKYKAITELFGSEGDDDICKMVKELKKDKENYPKDNITFAKLLYQCIDKDMRFALEKNGFLFNNNGLLVDRETTANAVIKKKGGQAATILKQAKKQVSRVNHDGVEQYWDKKAHELIAKKDENADPKSKKRTFTDTYNIAGAVNVVAEERRKYVAGDNNKKFFDMLKDNGNQLALSIYDIDKELEDAQDVFTRHEKDLKARPEMKSQLRQYINRRKQQQLDLMDRAAGVLNAMKYLSGSVAIDSNGSAVLKDIQYSFAKQQKEEEKKKKKQKEEEPEIEENDLFQEEDLVFGTKKNVTELAATPLTLKDTKKKLLEKFKNDPHLQDLKTALDKVKDSKIMSYLTISGIDLFSLSLSDVCTSLSQQISDADVKEKLDASIKEINNTVDFLYEEVERKGLETHTLRETTYLVEQFALVRKKLYAVNKLRTMKSAATGRTYDDMLGDGQQPALVASRKQNSVITNQKFKILSDNMEHYRCRHMKNLVTAGAASNDMCTGPEAGYLDKKNAKDLVRLYDAKRVAAERVRDKHKAEYEALMLEGTNNLLHVFRSKVQIPEAFTKINEIQEEEHEDEIHINHEDEILHEEHEHEDEQQRVKKENIDEEALKLHIESNFEGTFDTVHQEFEHAPEFNGGDDAVAATKQQIQKYILTNDFDAYNELAPQIQTSLENAKQGDQILAEVMKNAFMLMTTDVYKGTVVKNVAEKIVPGLHAEFDEERKNAFDVSVKNNNPDYIWFMNQLDKVQNLEDLKKLRTLWSARQEYVKQYYTAEMDFTVYSKIDGIMYAIGRAMDIMDTKQKIESVKTNILSYKSDKKADEPDFNLKTEDTENIYNFDQHQEGDLACWTASHTYVVNAYLKAHKIDVPKFTQSTLKNPENFIPHDSIKHYLDNKEDQNPDSMSFNKEAENIKNFLTQDKMGNPYIMADKVITSIPKTAEHHLVFTNYFMKNNVESTPEIKEKLSDYLMDKVEKELKRTKAPISILKGLHYLSIVGVDRQKKCFLTMNSLHEGAALNDYTELTVDSLLTADKFEMVYPEYLDDQNLTYIKNRFGMKDDLYDEEGKLKVDEKIQQQKNVHMEQSQNMLHVNGYEFDLDKEHYDHPFEDYFVNEQIYMPSNLDLPKTLQKPPV